MSQKLDTNQAAVRVGIHPKTLRRYARLELVSFELSGNKRLFDMETLRAELPAVRAKMQAKVFAGSTTT